MQILIFGHHPRSGSNKYGSGSGSVFSLKCWIWIKWIRIRKTGLSSIFYISPSLPQEATRMLEARPSPSTSTTVLPSATASHTSTALLGTRELMRNKVIEQGRMKKIVFQVRNILILDPRIRTTKLIKDPDPALQRLSRLNSKK